MARMIPPLLDDTAFAHVSKAERQVYQEMAKRLPADWVILHSLWLKNHLRKAHAECDFVMITNRAVLIVEVKGGEVSRTADGQWRYGDFRGSERVNKEGPFDQARDCYYALRAYLDERGQKQRLFFDLVWGYAVIIPHCIPLIPPDPQIDPDLILDERGFPERLPDFIDSVTRHWIDKCRELATNAGRDATIFGTEVSDATRQLLLNHLRPAFECAHSVGSLTRKAVVALTQLTEDQYAALDFAALNSRIVLVGSAGTGKTMLAFEQARRRSVAGQRVLLTCFNRLLADHLRRIASMCPEMNSVVVANYHQLLSRLARDAGMTANISDDWEAFNANAESLVLGAVETLGGGLYDYLIIDEGQDLLRSEFLESLSLLLVGGIDSGEWLMCMDRQQAVFQRQFDESALERMSKIAALVALRTNCRNTRQISAYVRGLTGAGDLAAARANGPHVVITYYKDPAEYSRVIRHAVNRAVQELQKISVTAADVCVMTTSLAFQPDEFRQPGFFVRRVQDPPADPDSDAAVLATVQAFKGLEATAVVLGGLESLETPLARMLLYIGASRAKALLYLVFPKACEAYVQAHLAELLTELGA